MELITLKFEFVYSGQDLNVEMLCIVRIRSLVLFPDTDKYSGHLTFLAPVLSKCFSFKLF